MQYDLGRSVIESACRSEVQDLAIDWAELGLDVFLSEGVLKDAPVISTVVKLCALSRTIRDRIFMRKVWDFLRGCPRFSAAETDAFIREHLDRAEKVHRLADALVLLLDRLDDLQKPLLLARAFAALVRGKISLEAFQRLAAAIDIGFFQDLHAFASCRGVALEQIGPVVLNLARTGLIHLKTGTMRRGMNAVWYEVSELGHQFQEHVAANID